MRRVWVITVVALSWLAACAPKTVPLPTVTTPRYPDYVFPGVPQGVGDEQLRTAVQRGWQFLQAGDLKNAQQEFSGAVRRDSSFFPADAGLGYVKLAQRDFKAALTDFDRALNAAADYVPALVGRGDALLGTSRDEEALKSFEAALDKDPSLSDVRRRVDVIRFRAQQESLKTAREAAEAGRDDEAREGYERAIQSSPDSAFLYRELAAVERKQGRDAQALEHLRHAVALDPNDVRSLTAIGEIEEARGEFEAAVRVYTQAAAIEPGEALSSRIDRARRKADLARLPPEYRAIADDPEIVRGQLAALIGVRLEGLLQRAPRQTILVTDARNHWAAPWIMAVTRADIMEVYANHTFRPRDPVHRADLALAVSRLLAVIERVSPAMAASWQTSPRVADVPPAHLSYAAVARAVASGIMPLVDGENFRPGRPVSGQEAIAVIDRIQALTGKSGS